LGDFKHRSQVFERVAKINGLIENLNYPVKLKAVKTVIESGDLDDLAADYEPPTIEIEKMKKKKIV